MRLKKDENVWVSYTNQRVHKHNNCLNLVVTGPPGSGKSWATLSFFYMLDPDFCIDGNFFFRARDLLYELKQGNFKAGKIWGFDEAGIDANNLSYFDAVNRGLNALFQTARHRNYVFGLTLPFLNMLSKGVRTLMTAQWEAKGWNKQNKTIIVPRVLEYNGELDKFYKKRLVVHDGSDLSFCNRMLLPKPPRKLVREYEKVKKEFTQDLYERTYKDILAFDKKAQEKSNKVLISEKEEVVLSFVKEGYNVDGVAEKLKIARRRVYDHLRALSKKGIVFKGEKDENNRIIRYKVVDYRDGVDSGGGCI